MLVIINIIIIIIIIIIRPPQARFRALVGPGTEGIDGDTEQIDAGASSRAPPGARGVEARTITISILFELILISLLSLRLLLLLPRQEPKSAPAAELWLY